MLEADQGSNTDTSTNAQNKFLKKEKEEEEMVAWRSKDERKKMKASTRYKKTRKQNKEQKINRKPAIN